MDSAHALKQQTSHAHPLLTVWTLQAGIALETDVTASTADAGVQEFNLDP